MTHNITRDHWKQQTFKRNKFIHLINFIFKSKCSYFICHAQHLTQITFSFKISEVSRPCTTQQIIYWSSKHKKGIGFTIIHKKGIVHNMELLVYDPIPVILQMAGSQLRANKFSSLKLIGLLENIWTLPENSIHFIFNGVYQIFRLHHCTVVR